jgi:O-antigen/teichoic acid export membrane protein
LFTSLLMMLSIAEAGIGSAIIYSLYKPVAEENEWRILVLMKLYRRIYMGISFIVLALGLCIMPFLGVFVKNTSVENLNTIYILFLLNTSLPYLFQHKVSFLNVCQKSYIVTAIYTVSSILSTSFKIAILYYTKNFILFLIIDVIINLLTAVILAVIVNRMYPMLRRKIAGILDPGTKRDIIKNVKAILLQRVGNYFVFGTDNLMISYFVSIVAVGLYSNYVMLIEICRTFINQIFNNMYHSVGNLVAKENKAKVYSVFKVTMLLNFWLYSMFAICLFILIEPFIVLWIGADYLMSYTVLVLLLLMFYERGMRNSITTVKTTAGIFHEDRFAPIIQAVINLSLSLVLVQFVGIAGIFIGTLISAAAVPFWVTPYLVYRKVFYKPVYYYVVTYAVYTLIGIGACVAADYVCSYIPDNHFAFLIAKGLVSLMIVNLIYAGVFYKTAEFKYLLGIAHMLMSTLRAKTKIIRKVQG